MVLHLVFVILYILVGPILGGELLNIIMVVQCVLGIYQLFQKKKELLSPLTIFYLAGILVSIGNVNLIGIMGTPENFSYRYIIPQYVPQASLIWVIGSSMIFIGYDVATKWSLPKLEYNLTGDQVNGFFKIILVVSLLSTVLFRLLFAFGTFAKLMVLAGSIGILFFARLWASENNTKYRDYTVLLFIIQTAYGFFISYVRFRLIMPTLVLLLGYFAGKKQVKAMFTSTMAPYFAFVMIFVLSFNTLSHYRGRYEKAITKELIAPDEEEEEDEDVFLYKRKSETSFFTRLSCLAQISCIVKLVEDNGTYNGQASAPIAISLIPRFLWPGKPKIEMGLWFALEIGAAYEAEGKRGNNSINMTVPGELYLDFGWAGLAIGCLIFGVIIAMFWHSVQFDKSDYNIIGILFGGYLLLQSLYAPTLDLQLLVTFTSMYILFYIVTGILKANKA